MFLIAKNKFSICFKGMLAGLILTGLLARIGFFTPHPSWHLLLSFTNISNGYLLILTLLTLIHLGFKKTSTTFSLRFSNLRVIGVAMILITGLVYHFILLPQKLAIAPAYPVLTYGNITAHYIVPIGMFFDWILFDPKGRIKKWQPLLFLTIPIGYFILISTYRYISVKILNRPVSSVYFFMDFDALGVLGVVQWAGFLLFLFLGITYGIYFIDYFLATKKSPASSSPYA